MTNLQRLKEDRGVLRLDYTSSQHFCFSLILSERRRLQKTEIFQIKPAATTAATTLTTSILMVLLDVSNSSSPTIRRGKPTPYTIRALVEDRGFDSFRHSSISPSLRSEDFQNHFPQLHASALSSIGR